MVKRSDLFRSLAKTVAATAFGGPVAGAAAGVGQAIDLVGGWLSDRDRDAYQAVLARVGVNLEQLAASERLPAAVVDQALLETQAIIARHGATLAEMNRLGLDPVRISRAVLRRADALLAMQDEGVRQLCERSIGAVYGALLQDSDALPGLQLAFNREVLARLDEIPRLPAAVAEALRSAAASTLVRDRTRRWSPDLFAPSALLRAEFCVVPFQGREDELSSLEQWCADDRDLAVRLYTGAGGMGKTRLMIEAAGRLESQGWRAGFLSSDVGAAAPLEWLLRESAQLLLVVDYAETRRRDVRHLVSTALDRHGGNLRIVMLARARADWWRDLLREGQGVGELLTGPATAVEALSPLATDAADRLSTYRLAVQSFAATLGRPEPEQASPSLVGDHYDRVLFLLLSALATVEGVDVGDEDGLLDFALRREQGFWDSGMREMALDQLAGRAIAQAAAVATLAGTAGDRASASSLLSSAPLLAGQPAVVVDAIAELLHRLYPGEHWLEGVQPDLLGEHLVAQAIAEDPTLLGVFSAQ